MSTKSWSHGRDCDCDKCQKRREYYKKYYESNKEKILKKNRLWMKQHRKYPRSTPESVRRKIARTKRSKYGRTYFKRLGSLGGNRLIELYGIDYLTSILKKGKVNHDVWRIAIDKEANIHQHNILDRINSLMDSKNIGQ